MGATITLRERAGGRTTCVWCHAGASRADAGACAGCGALYHPACRDEAGRCGTLGCDESFEPDEPAERVPARVPAPPRPRLRCARCGGEGVVVGLVRCPHRAAVYHWACRSDACPACRAGAPRRHGEGASRALLVQSAVAVVRVLLVVGLLALLVSSLRGATLRGLVPVVVAFLGPVAAALLLQRWR